jgi:hypothetical protein
LELFPTENALRTVAGYNVHENFSRRQYGGTFQLTFGALAARVVDTGVDSRNLGQYAWTKFQGRNGHVARIVSIYVPCRMSCSSKDLTVMNQHRQYLESRGIFACPRTVLLDDIRTCLQEWRQAGERSVIFLDANEIAMNGPFHDMFVSPGLQMRKRFFTAIQTLAGPKQPLIIKAKLLENAQLMECIQLLASRLTQQLGYNLCHI